MRKIILILSIAIITLLHSCSIPEHTINRQTFKKLSTDEKKLADTLAKKILDNEGLFTVISRLKPMSSVMGLNLDIAQKDTSISGVRNVTDVQSPDLVKLKEYQKVINAMHFADLGFIMNGYKISNEGKRNIFINIYRKSLIDSLINANQTYFGQFGFVPGSDPRQVILQTEFGNKYDRYRSYGYLFGYPEHAVTFFTEASRKADETKVFVERDFFQIPVYDGPTGHFVYAIEKNTPPTEIDSAIHKRAAFNLELYKKLRNKYKRPDSSIKYMSLLRKLVKMNE